MRILSLVILVVLCANPATWAGDGVVALQTADPSCANDSVFIYVDCGNGTVTDNRTGLVWLANAGCIGAPDVVDWSSAMDIVAGLSDLPGSDPDDCGLSDGSSPGEWRLPSKAEWKAMIADADGGPGDLDCNPVITIDFGSLCWTMDCYDAGFCSFFGVKSSGNYWSLSTRFSEPSFVWCVALSDGDFRLCSKDNKEFIWPVRGGQ